MLKKDKPMLSVDAIIQSQGSKIGWDRPFSGNESQVDLPLYNKSAEVE